ncbi:MAG: hypothetical protein A2428_07385 [Bdellovibrionales bacterium RIFOXYC1_FULL_54_43]|nr:MAG: hypothetical protein A2428_07385 [Bdellovibrionales bacterium RIFOXYC1_FULL_54_43]OFZ85053.1 MAG: hypothetical protein A2603_07860 [Bdellovibrionales bacterium RIFOXYD1_FULL_55_31]
MIWKPREKQLTAEEAIALAKKELRPLWFGSEPLLAAINHQGGITAHPLDPAFSSRGWVILFIDPTSFAGESTITYAREWHRRYDALNLGFLLVLRFPYPDVYSRTSIEDKFIALHRIEFPVALDGDGLLSASFGASETPKMVLTYQQKNHFEKSGLQWFPEGESRVQEFLRANDPGLPLPPVFSPQLKPGNDNSKLELGSTHFKALRRIETLPETSPSGVPLFTGKWDQTAASISTADPEAKIAIHCPSSKLSLIARSMLKTVEPASISIQVDGMPAFEEFFGADLQQDDDGRTVARVGSAWLYRVLDRLPAKNRQVTISFPEADRVRVSLYGLRFGE